MELSRAISLVAVVLIIIVVAGYATTDGASAEAAEHPVAIAK